MGRRAIKPYHPTIRSHSNLIRGEERRGAERGREREESTNALPAPVKRPAHSEKSDGQGVRRSQK